MLRWHEVSNTSRIVQWLTPAHGRISTLIKGAQRPRSAFLGQLDLFYTCELQFYAHDRDGLHIARSCEPLEFRTALRSRWRAAAVASHACGLILRTLPRQAPVPEVYEWLGELLDDLAARDHHAGALVWFELHLLGRLGMAPRLDTCGDCGAAVDGREPGLRFCEARGGVLHRACAEREPEASASLSAPVLSILRACRRAAHPGQVRTIAATPGQRRELHHLLSRFYAHHLEMDPLPRQLLQELLDRPPLLAEAS